MKVLLLPTKIFFFLPSSLLFVGHQNATNTIPMYQRAEVKCLIVDFALIMKKQVSNTCFSLQILISLSYLVFEAAVSLSCALENSRISPWMKSRARGKCLIVGLYFLMKKQVFNTCFVTDPSFVVVSFRSSVVSLL